MTGSKRGMEMPLAVLIGILVVIATVVVLLIIYYSWYKQGGSVLDYLFRFFE